VVADERRGAEDEKGENPVDAADQRRGDRPRRERLDSQAADHGGVGEKVNRLAGDRQHGGDRQFQDVAQIRGRNIGVL